MQTTLIEPNHVFTGRKKLITSLLPANLIGNNYGATAITSETLAEDLSYQFQQHSINSAECQYLLNYYKGKQPILDRHDDNRVNDVKTVVNYAYAISRNISSYTYSGGVQYVSSNPEYFDAVKIINDFMKRENKQTVSKEVQDYQSICGAAYMAILPDATNKNNVPFELKFLSPVSTFVVYSCFNPSVPVYGCTYFKVRSKKDNNWTEKYVYQVYTQNEIYIFKAIGSAQIKSDSIAEGFPKVHILGAVPIVEFRNNAFCIGDFEPALPVLNSGNSLTSDCLYNIQSVVTSFFAMFGVELEDGDIEKMRKDRIMVFRGAPGINQDAKFIYMQLDGTATEFLRNYLEGALKFIVGVPDRDSGQVGSDTGVAAEMRTGQGDIEVVAKTKALYAAMAERQILDIALNILSPRYIPEGINSSDIDVEITRINRADMLTKTQSLMNMDSIGFPEEDSVYFANITNDVAGVSDRWRANKEKLKKQVEQSKPTSTENIVVEKEVV